MDFSKLKAITIPQGVVKSISKDGILLWFLKVSERLPSEYQEVEHLTAPANQETYIDLGYAFDTRATIYMENTIIQKGVTTYTFGAAEKSGQLRCMLTSPYSDAGASIYGSTGTSYNQATFKYTENVMNWWEMVFESGRLSMTDLIRKLNSTNTTQGSYTMTSNLYLFAQNYNGTIRYGGPRQVGKFRYYDKNDVMVFDLIPCYRKSDNKPGMYDTVSKNFFTNIGKGTDFTIGPIVEFVNQVFISIDTDGTIYRKVGYRDNCRVTSIGDTYYSSSTVITCTGFIPLKKGETLEISPVFTGLENHNAINFADANFNNLGQVTDSGNGYGICENNVSLYKTTVVNGKSTLTLTDQHDSRIAYVRVSHNINNIDVLSTGAKMVVTVSKKETSNLLDMTTRTIYTGYTDNYIETTATHEMDYTKIYALDPTYRRGAYPTSKFTELTVLDGNGFSANCSSSSGYKLSFPIDVKSGKAYRFTATLNTVGYIKLMKYNSDKTFNNVDTNLITTTGTSSCTFTAESGCYYAIVFPFANGIRAFENISLVEEKTKILSPTWNDDCRLSTGDGGLRTDVAGYTASDKIDLSLLEKVGDKLIVTGLSFDGQTYVSRSIASFKDGVFITSYYPSAGMEQVIGDSGVTLKMTNSTYTTITFERTALNTDGSSYSIALCGYGSGADAVVTLVY